MALGTIASLSFKLRHNLCLEESTPKIASAKARLLNCAIPRLRKQYCDRLGELAAEHKMTDKLHRLTDEADRLDRVTLQARHNQWDYKWGQLMRAAEKDCTKAYNTMVEFSPEINLLIQRRSTLRWILRYQDGKVPDTGNLVRAAKAHQLDRPLELSRNEVQQRLHAVIQQLHDKKKVAPSLRHAHLIQCLQQAQREHRLEDEVQIKHILRWEADSARQQRINRAVRNQRDVR